MRMDKIRQSYQGNTGNDAAPYEAALLVTENKKAHTVVETLIVPAAKGLVRDVIREEQRRS